MSTWIYLRCTCHNPPLIAPDESGQHLYDLPQIREDIANREWLAENFDDVVNDLGYFRLNSARFLKDHPRCVIDIVDEYGKTHPVKEQQP